MKKEDIEKAARSYSSIWAGTPLHVNDILKKDYFESGFQEGAEWRMNEVWHRCDDRSVKIEGDDDVMVLLENGKIYNYNDDWEEECCLVVMWAYMKDLLPNMED